MTIIIFMVVCAAIIFISGFVSGKWQSEKKLLNADLYNKGFHDGYTACREEEYPESEMIKALNNEIELQNQHIKMLEQANQDLVKA